MTSIDAVYADGVFKPIGSVSMPENLRVRLTIETVPTADVAEWPNAVRAFQTELQARHGVFPDSTPEIVAERRTHV